MTSQQERCPDIMLKDISTKVERVHSCRLEGISPTHYWRPYCDSEV